MTLTKKDNATMSITTLLPPVCMVILSTWRVTHPAEKRARCICALPSAAADLLWRAKTDEFDLQIMQSVHKP